jgi:hypothetical protein
MNGCCHDAAWGEVYREVTLLSCNPGFARLCALCAQTQPPSQTARQALLEMFFNKTPGTFEKHLPEATRTALHKADAQAAYSLLQGFSTMTAQLNANGAQLQTFEAGPILLIAEDQRNQSKMEIIVERDDLQGDEDEIEVTFHAYRSGQEQNSFLMPRLTFVMNQEQASGESTISC